MAAKTFFKALSLTGTFFQNFLLLAFRLYWGWNFYNAGLRKLNTIHETTAFFAQLKIPMPELMAYLVPGIEIVGGVLLIIGLASRLAAIPLSIIMVTALLTAHVKATMGMFSNPEEFLAEPPVTFLMVTLMVFVFGSGWFSVDYLIRRLTKKSNA